MPYCRLDDRTRYPVDTAVHVAFTGPMESDCPFCTAATERIVHTTTNVIALRDGFPLSEGHTLVVPRQHVASLFDLVPAQQQELWDVVRDVRAALLGSGAPDGFNIGVNDGTAAGQTVAHAHVHVIPRYSGDVDDPRGGVRWVLAKRAAYW